MDGVFCNTVYKSLANYSFKGITNDGVVEIGYGIRHYMRGKDILL